MNNLKKICIIQPGKVLLIGSKPLAGINAEI